MNLNEYKRALRTAGEIVTRHYRGTVPHRLTAGMTDSEVADVAFWLLKANETLAILGQPDDDPLEPHPDLMRADKP